MRLNEIRLNFTFFSKTKWLDETKSSAQRDKKWHLHEIIVFALNVFFVVFMECLAHKNFSGKFGKVRAKFLRTQKICLPLHLCVT